MPVNLTQSHRNTENSQQPSLTQSPLSSRRAAEGSRSQESGVRSQGGQGRAGHEDAAGTMAVLGGGKKGGGRVEVPLFFLIPNIFRLFLCGLGELCVRLGCSKVREFAKGSQQPGKGRDVAGEGGARGMPGCFFLTEAGQPFGRKGRKGRKEQPNSLVSRKVRQVREGTAEQPFLTQSPRSSRRNSRKMKGCGKRAGTLSCHPPFSKY